MNFSYLKEIYSYRALIAALAVKEIKIKFKSAVLGWLWSVLNPFLLMVVFFVIFTHIIKMGVEKFPAFLLCALLPWFFFSFSLSQATTSIVENASLLKKAYFPYEVIPLSVVAANLYNFLLSLILLFAFLIFYQSYPTVYWFFLPMIIFLQGVFVLGVCFVFAALHTVFRDIKYAVELLLIIWFYATPIFYPISFVPEKIRSLFYYNPLCLFVILYRDILLYQKIPSGILVAKAIIFSLLSFLLGLIVFRRYKRFFTDVT